MRSVHAAGSINLSLSAILPHAAAAKHCVRRVWLAHLVFLLEKGLQTRWVVEQHFLQMLCVASLCCPPPLLPRPCILTPSTVASLIWFSAFVRLFSTARKAPLDVRRESDLMRRLALGLCSRVWWARCFVCQCCVCVCVCVLGGCAR